MAPKSQWGAFRIGPTPTVEPTPLGLLDLTWPLTTSSLWLVQVLLLHAACHTSSPFLKPNLPCRGGSKPNLKLHFPSCSGQDPGLLTCHRSVPPAAPTSPASPQDHPVFACPVPRDKELGEAGEEKAEDHFGVRPLYLICFKLFTFLLPQHG